jgi:hypothetical protein
MDQLDQITLLMIALQPDGSDDDKIQYDFDRSQQIAPFSVHPQGNGWYTYFFPAREIAAASSAFTRRLITFGVTRLNNAATAPFYVGDVRFVTRPGAMRLRLAPGTPSALGAYLPVDRSGANRFWMPLSNGWHTYKFDSSWGIINTPLTVDGSYSLVLDWLYTPLASYQAIRLLGNSGGGYANGSAWEKRPNWEALSSSLWWMTWVNTDLVLRDVRVGLVADIPPSLLNPTARSSAHPGGFTYDQNAGMLSPVMIANNQGQLGWNLVGELVALDTDGNLLYEAQHHMSRPGIDQGSANGWRAQHSEKPLDIRLPARSHFQLTNVRGNNSQGLTSGFGHGGIGAYFKNAALAYLSTLAYAGGSPNAPFDTEYQLKLIDTMWNPTWSQWYNFSNLGITLRATCFYTHPRTWRLPTTSE